MADGSSKESSIEDHKNACCGRKLDSDKNKNAEEKEAWDDISTDEEDLIEKLHNLLGDRWELIAGRLPDRTAEEVKKYWTMKERKKFMQTKLFRPISVRARPLPRSGTSQSSEGRGI